LPPEAQDKRGEAHIEPKDWDTWLHGTIEEATRLLVPAPPEMFNQTQAQQIDQQLKAIESTMASIDQDDLF